MQPHLAFSVSVELLDERTNLVCAVGEIDASAVNQFEQRLLDSIGNPRIDAVVVDLTAVTFIGSAALTALVRSLELPARHELVRVAIAADDSRVTSILEVSRLDRVFPVRRTRAEAIAETRRPAD